MMPSDHELQAHVDELLRLLAELGRRHPLGDPVAGISGGDTELTSQQLHSVLWLGRDGPLTNGMLAQRLGTSVSTCTGIVDRLEDRGLVERTRNEADRRVVVVRLTHAGEARYRSLKQKGHARVAAIFGRLNAKDRRALLAIVGRLLTTDAPQKKNGVAPRRRG